MKIDILYKGFLIPLGLIFVVFVFVLVHISDEKFDI